MKGRFARVALALVVGLFVVGTAGVVILANPRQPAPLPLLASAQLLGTTTTIYGKPPAKSAYIYLATPLASWQSGKKTENPAHYASITKALAAELVHKTRVYLFHRPFESVKKDLLAAQSAKSPAGFRVLTTAGQPAWARVTATLTMPSGEEVEIDLLPDKDPQTCRAFVYDTHEITWWDKAEAWMHNAYRSNVKTQPLLVISTPPLPSSLTVKTRVIVR